MSGKEVGSSEPPAHMEVQGKARLMYNKGNKAGAENSSSQMPRGYYYYYFYNGWRPSETSSAVLARWSIHSYS